MATGREQGSNENFAERGIRFLRDIHIAIGAVALAGAVFFPQIEIFSVIAAYETINALAHEGLRQVVKSRNAQQSTTSA